MHERITSNRDGVNLSGLSIQTTISVLTLDHISFTPIFGALKSWKNFKVSPNPNTKNVSFNALNVYIYSKSDQSNIVNNCFENYITLEGLSPEISPRSGLYINDLPGVTKAMFTGLMSEDLSEVEEYWTRLYKRSVENFIDEVASRMDQEFNVEKVIDSQKTGNFDKPFALNDSPELESGVKIEVVKTRYSVTEILVIDIYSVGSPDPSDVILKIIDDESDKVLWSKSVDLEEGLNTIDVFECFDSKKLRIVYNPSEVASYTTNQNRNSSCYQSCATDAASKITQYNGGGLIAEFVTKCSISAFICSQISRFKLALWYYIGVELMTDAVLSRNVNCFTIDREEAKNQMGLYEEEVNKKLDNALKRLRIKDDLVCFDCRGTVSKATLLP